MGRIGIDDLPDQELGSNGDDFRRQLFFFQLFTSP
jgi:hypothetical protein